MAQIKVGVVGAGGRMGRAVCTAVMLDPDLELVAAVAPRLAGESHHGLTFTGELRSLAEAGCDVVVDFTNADAARVTVPWLAMHGVHAVVGTTGFTDADIDAFRSEFSGSNCIIVANFAISAVLMMRFAELAAPYFDSAEIIELHHEGKIDAPSGTAVATAQRMAAASDEWTADPTQHERYPGSRGAAGPAGIRMHSVRMPGLQAHLRAPGPDIGSRGDAQHVDVATRSALRRLDLTPALAEVGDVGSDHDDNRRDDNRILPPLEKVGDRLHLRFELLGKPPQQR